MDEVIGEVAAGICEFVVEVTADVIGSLSSGNEEKEKETIQKAKNCEIYSYGFFIFSKQHIICPKEELKI